VWKQGNEWCGQWLEPHVSRVQKWLDHVDQWSLKMWKKIRRLTYAHYRKLKEWLFSSRKGRRNLDLSRERELVKLCRRAPLAFNEELPVRPVGSWSRHRSDDMMWG